MFGIRYNKVSEILLRESNLTLLKTDEICRASERTAAQIKEVDQTDSVNAVSCKDTPHGQRMNKWDNNSTEQTATKECGNCGRKHDSDKCRARGKTFNEFGKRNHFAAVCQSKERTNTTTKKPDVRGVEDSDKDNEDVYIISDVAAVALDDSQLNFQSGLWQFLRFQPDTGAQCNVIPVHLYKLRVPSECDTSKLSNICIRRISTSGSWKGTTKSMAGQSKVFVRL